MATTTLLDDLAACVDGAAREAGPDDAIGGVPAAVVASPATTAQAAAVMAAADRAGLHVAFRGRGTALSWGAPPTALDLLVDTTRLDAVVEHAAGDLICVVQAGARLDDVNAQVREHGQQLALDQPVPGASVGGTLATARSGPRRVRYGAPRDLVLGVTVVRADGVVAKAGGKVVKNVAGYDLAKLVTGSLGTLALVTEAVFRLHPLPAASRWVGVSCADPGEAARRAHAVIASQLAASAVEVERRPGGAGVDVRVLLEGTGQGVDQRTTAVLELLGAGAAELGRDGGPGAVEGAGVPAGLPAGADDLLVKLAVPISGVGGLLAAVADAEQRHGVPLHLRGSAGVGVLYAGAPGGTAPEAVAAVLARLRAATVEGSAVLLQAPPPVRAAVDAWGPVPGLALMRRVKDQFDPQHRLAPGRFVGGI
jgi:glycolate oxidase FAD binding subunit